MLVESFEQCVTCCGSDYLAVDFSHSVMHQGSHTFSKILEFFSLSKFKALKVLENRDGP